MRIVHFINCLRGGGAQRMVELLACEQKSTGHDCSVVCLGSGDSDIERRRMTRLSKSGIDCYCLGRDYGAKLKAIFSIRKLAKWMDEKKPDIINSHLALSHFVAGAACRIACHKQVRHIATIHNIIEDWPLLYFPILRNTPHVYCSFEGQFNTGYRGGCSTVIENGIDFISTSRIVDRRATLARLGVPQDSYVVLSVGSMRPQKNYANAIRVVAETRSVTNINLHYLICGRTDGGDYDNVKKVIDDVKGDIWVHLLGVRDDVSEVLATADCYLSTALWEGLPLSVLEALFTGLPCVLSPISIHQKLAAKASACEVPTSMDIESFSKVLIKLLSDSSERSMLIGQRIHQLADYTIANCAGKYIEFYKKIMHQSR